MLMKRVLNQNSRQIQLKITIFQLNLNTSRLHTSWEKKTLAYNIITPVCTTVTVTTMTVAPYIVKIMKFIAN